MNRERVRAITVFAVAVLVLSLSYCLRWMG